MKKKIIISCSVILAITLIAFMIDCAIFFNYMLKKMSQELPEFTANINNSYGKLVIFNSIGAALLFVMSATSCILKTKAQNSSRVLLLFCEFLSLIFCLIVYCINLNFFKRTFLSAMQGNIEDLENVYILNSPHYQFSIAGIVICCALIVCLVVAIIFEIYRIIQVKKKLL